MNNLSIGRDAEGNIIVVGNENSIIIGKDKPTADALMKEGVRFIEGCEYGKALHTFKKIIGLEPSMPDIHYYIALTLLNGKRPSVQSFSTIQEIERRLKKATELNAECWHAYILWAIVKEDYYEMSGMGSHPPTPVELYRRVKSIKYEHLNEMLTHIRAPKNRIWESLQEIC